jgi:hypothetical protein
MIRRFALLLVLIPVLHLPLAAQTWSRLQDLSIPRSGAGAVYIGSGRVLVVGGSIGIPELHDPKAIPVATCDIVDAWRGTTTAAASMTVARAEFVALSAPDSNVVVIGGATGSDPNGAVTGSVELYDRTSGAWRTVGSLRTARRQHVAGFIDDHRILVVGGRLQNYTSLTDAEIFDLRTGTSTQAAPFPYPINASTLITSHSGELVVVGGRTGGSNSERRAEVYAYDAATDEWVLNSVLAQAVSGVSGLRLWDRRIIIAGGLHSDLPGQSATEVQLENTGKWKLISPMLAPRTNAGLAQWSENRVLVLGGFHSDRVPVATTEWIDMAHHTSTAGPTMAIARDRFTAISVPAAPEVEPHVHSIIAIGGLASPSSLTAAVEILRPAAELIATILRDSSDRSVLLGADRTMRVAYAVAAATHVRLTVAGSDGRIYVNRVKEVESGAYDEVLDLGGAPAGLCHVRLTIAGEERRWQVMLP